MNNFAWPDLGREPIGISRPIGIWLLCRPLKMGRNFLVLFFFVFTAKSSLSYYFERIKRASSLILLA